LGRQLNEPLWCDDDYGYGEHLIERSTKTPARTWSALYQQRPAPEEGDYFHVDWLRPYEKAPDLRTLKVYGASDYAVTADGGDYTVHIVIGIDPQWRMYVLDLWHARTSSDRWIEAFCDLVLQWKPIGWAEEQGQIRAGVGPSGTLTSPGRSSQRVATRRCERSLFADEWSSTASMCR
jgi:hypothetical protein